MVVLDTLESTNVHYQGVCKATGAAYKGTARAKVLEVLEGKDRQLDGIATFLPTGSALRPISKQLHEARRRAHKEVADLSTERRDDGDPTKAWPASLLPELFLVLGEFANAALPAKLDVSARDYIREQGAQIWAQSAEAGKTQ
jgi:hypothetical protein